MLLKLAFALVLVAELGSFVGTTRFKDRYLAPQQFHEKNRYPNFPRPIKCTDCINGACVNQTMFRGVLYGFCECRGGWKGTNCSKNINECATHDYPGPGEGWNCHGGRCVDKPGYAYCVCPACYAGCYCEHAIDYCWSNPCLNGGTCVFKTCGFDCHCPPPWTGPTCGNWSGRTETPTSPRPPKTTTITLPTSTVTATPPKTPTPPSTGPSTPPTPTGPTPTGPTGPTSKPPTTPRGPTSRPPTTPRGPTSKPPTTPRGPTSKPPATPTSSPTTTTTTKITTIKDTTPTTTTTSTSSTSTKKTSTQTPTHTTPTSSKGPTTTPAAPTPTPSKGPTTLPPCVPCPCFNQGQCSFDDDGEFKSCNCLLGFEGKYCETNVNDCDPDPCPRTQVCVDGINNHTCVPGPDYCVGVTCQHGGTCSYGICVCPPEYTGDRCQTKRDLCSPNPCKHGQCLDSDSSPRGYLCNCLSGWVGANCDVQAPACKNCSFDYCGQYLKENGQPACEHGGTCKNQGGTWFCTCPCGFYGRRCEINPDDCVQALQPCLHGGTCIDGVNSFTCRCPPGYIGKFCQEMLDYCQSSPCQNGGICSPIPNAYNCTCPPVFTGAHCETDVNECEEGRCKNGATCLNWYGGYNCTCPHGFIGTDCEYDEKTYSRDPPALNEIEMCPKGDQMNDIVCQHGLCMTDKKDRARWTCLCENGYCGRHCETECGDVKF